MLISFKRHQRELAAAVALAAQVNEEIISRIPAAIFLLDQDNRIRAPLSRSLTTLFGGRNLTNLNFEKVLQSILDPKTLAVAREYLAWVRSSDASPAANLTNPLQKVVARIASADGSISEKTLDFSFQRFTSGANRKHTLVTISDLTALTEQAGALEDLRRYSQVQAACLAGIAQVGSDAFRNFLQSAQASIAAINVVLKKPARETSAFRAKLEEIQRHVEDVNREATNLKIGAIQSLASAFEDSLIGLKSIDKLTGTDLLPLAVRLDALFALLITMRSMTSATRKAADSLLREAGVQSVDRVVTPSIESVPAAPVAVHTVPSSNLESALRSLTEHAAQTNHKSVSLVCSGLNDVPDIYQGTVKNIAMQFIRNAIVHGIESPEQRSQASKPSAGRLNLDFLTLEDGTFELRFEDDGGGLDPDLLRRIAVAKGLISESEAQRLQNRQAIKLIFKSGFSTVEQPSKEIGRGLGMSRVRRHVADAGGRVGLASTLGEHTRFRVSLPRVAEIADTQVA